MGNIASELNELKAEMKEYKDFKGETELKKKCFQSLSIPL